MGSLIRYYSKTILDGKLNGENKHDSKQNSTHEHLIEMTSISHEVVKSENQYHRKNISMEFHPQQHKKKQNVSFKIKLNKR